MLINDVHKRILMWWKFLGIKKMEITAFFQNSKFPQIFQRKKFNSTE